MQRMRPSPTLKKMLDTGLELPRTWDQYNAIAAATHGKVFKNQTLIGSCIGRVKGCAGAYWANLVLSSMTQVRGTWEGQLFDSADMTPLLGEAFEKMLELMETQARYGPEDEFEDCVNINQDYMNDGSCVLSYNWGNTFKVRSLTIALISFALAFSMFTNY